MTRQQLVDQIFSKRSYLCVGLDTDNTKIPKHLLSTSDPVFEFNKQIIDATRDFELQKFVTKTDSLDEGIHIEKHDVRFLYEMVLEKVSRWGSPDNLMFVVGATQPHEFDNIRQITPQHFYLVPGVGAQGGSLKEISEKAMIKETSTRAQCGILVNLSRAIIYASDKENFAEEARNISKQYQL